MSKKPTFFWASDADIMPSLFFIMLVLFVLNVVMLQKQKAKIQDLKVKFAAARLEFKEQITSLGTKMELTSQSLVRETEQKQRGAEFFEAENFFWRKKFISANLFLKIAPRCTTA